MRANIKVKPYKGQSQVYCSMVTPEFCILPSRFVGLPLPLRGIASLLHALWLRGTITLVL